MTEVMNQAMSPTGTRPFADDDGRWQAVLRRDPGADGHFCYAVATTGVFCRPSCPSRPKRRENVSFHADAASARRAGYRPCLRCRPEEPAAALRRAGAVEAACRLIERALDDGDPVPPLADLADGAGLSRFHFHRVFKEATGVTPKGYAAACRARRVQEELVSAGSVTEAIYGAGYGSSGRFYEGAAAVLGMRPSDYRDGGRGSEIRFAVGECSLGSILVAATGQGVCAIRFGDDPQALVRELEDAFPKARLLGGDAAFEALVARVVAHVESPRGALDLPLDVRGTAFQQRVWRALTEIPPGRTASYAEVAAGIGQPRATRAVARACAANPVAVAIPCHRVVRTDGALSGYRWGVERKRALLDREAAD